jgi:hypothetical protein
MKLYFNSLFLPLIAIILLYVIFQMIHYLVKENYIIERFTNIDSSKTSHSVDLPLNTTNSCKNFCGPNSRCAISGQQCFTDIDCPGCTPATSSTNQKTTSPVPGSNDAGKLTIGVTPTYSSLTSGYGTREKVITKNMYSSPAQANFGYDTWGKLFNEGQELFNKRYKPNELQYMPKYPPMYSITGEFIGDGPLPSNY